MAINLSFLEELKNESAKTRKLLSRVPVDNPTWKPHEKSMELQRLARHVAELPSWCSIVITTPELDFAKPYEQSPPLTSAEALVAEFDKNVERAGKALEATNDEHLMGNWSLRNEDHIFFTLPRHEVLRDMVFNHLVHHRAQLGVYLRMLNIPLPGMYGPTADEMS